MTAYRISPDPILNAFIDGDSTSAAICLVRRVNGQRTIERVECSYAAFWKRSDLRDGNGTVTPLGRALLASGARLEACGTESPIWIRGGWARDEGRKWMDSALRAASHEADVDPIRRWFIDTGCRVASPRRAYFDLETDSRVPFNLKERARILSWAVVSESGRSWSAVIQEDSDLAEAELLVAFWSLVERFDQLLAWNGDNFDFPVIRARTARLAAMDTSADDPSLDPADADSPFATLANIDPRLWLWLDHLTVYDRMNTAESGDEKTSLKLNSVAQALLGEKKHDFDASKTWQEWESPHLPPTERAESRARLLAYCVQDTVLLKKIEDKTGFIRLFQTLCEACNVLPDSKGLNPTQQVDGFLLKLADERGHHFPTRQYAKSVEKFRGAYVMQPTGKGIVKDCHVADFASLYPSIILSWNMSPETKIATVGQVDRPGNVVPSNVPSNAPSNTSAPTNAPTALAPTGTRFRTDVPGILPIALDELLRLRKDWNDRKSALPPGTPEWYDADRRSTAYKVAANSFYGVMGSPYSRYFDKDVGEAVTQSGVWLIHCTIEAAKERGWDTVYADTDSLFTVGPTREEFGAFVADCNAGLYPKLLASRGCVVNRIKLAYEKEFKRIVFTSAKRYCNPPETPIMMPDFSFRYLDDINVGDVVMGWVDGDSARKRHLVSSRVVAVHRRKASIVKVSMDSGSTIRCTPDHQWLRARRIQSHRGDKSYSYAWCTPAIGREIVKIAEIPAVLSLALKLEAAWLGGIFDGEGSLCGYTRDQIVISQSPKVNANVCARIEQVLANLGFDFSVWDEKNGMCNRYAITGGKQARLNFLTWCHPVKRDKLIEGMMSSFFGHSADKIVDIEPDGFGEVIGLTTETGNYVAWGYASKNCGTYSHYKGKAATSDSKPEIKGLEYKRGDATLLARRLQSEVINLFVSGCENPRDYQTIVERHKGHVLYEDLPIEEVQLSKTLSKAIDEYTVKRKGKGADAGKTVVVPNPLAHVKIARQMRDKGEEVGVGTRIGYVVKDGSKRIEPIHVSDFDGSNADRYYLWERLVFPPTLRLLAAMFPNEKWDQHRKVPRVSPNQMTLFPR